ncbi:hypothetical protein [Desulfolithobacter sp.]
MTRAGAINDLMGAGQLKALFSGIDSWPSLPSLYVRLQEPPQGPDTTKTDVAAIISKHCM